MRKKNEPGKMSSESRPTSYLQAVFTEVQVHGRAGGTEGREVRRWGSPGLRRPL